MSHVRDKIERKWMQSHFPQFKETTEGFRCSFDSNGRLQSAQFIKTGNGQPLFESYRLEITDEDAIYYPTMGIDSGDSRSEDTYNYAELAQSRFSGHPDNGSFIFEKKPFEAWVANCLKDIISDSNKAERTTKFPGRSLHSRKPRVD